MFYIMAEIRRNWIKMWDASEERSFYSELLLQDEETTCYPYISECIFCVH